MNDETLSTDSVVTITSIDWPPIVITFVNKTLLPLLWPFPILLEKLVPKLKEL